MRAVCCSWQYTSGGSLSSELDGNPSQATWPEFVISHQLTRTVEAERGLDLLQNYKVLPL